MAQYRRLRIIVEGEYVNRKGEFLDDWQEVECPIFNQRHGVKYCMTCFFKRGVGEVVVQCAFNRKEQ